MVRPALLLLCFGPLLALAAQQGTSATYLQKYDDLHLLWSRYCSRYIENGRIVSHDEGGITTSEGQSYAMLRAVWINDRETFDRVWQWTRKNLMARDDFLFAWKWKDKVLDKNAASDADVDIALALLLASSKFNEKRYAYEASKILDDIWDKEVIRVGQSFYLTGGNWAPGQRYPTVHVGYLAPHAYAEFARFDTRHPWDSLVASSYRILHWLYEEKNVVVPPEKIYIDKKEDVLLFTAPGSDYPHRFSYDVFPLFWRIAMDFQWHNRDEPQLRATMLDFFRTRWREHGKFSDVYSVSGTPQSKLEALPLYATVAALAATDDEEFAAAIIDRKLAPLWEKALDDERTPYYLHNWLWFHRALELRLARHYHEFLAFLYPFDMRGFRRNFPLLLFIVAVLLFALTLIPGFKYHRYVKIAFLSAGLLICTRYIVWRLFNSLNFIEPAGPIISITLWLVEIYCLSTVALLTVQVGFGRDRTSPPPAPDGFRPSVDIMIPIYSEPLVILEKTLVAARAIDYPNKTVYVCDDSHKPEVRELSERLGARYIKGPKKHAKAGNLNNALGQTNGELILIFDTDHIPTARFLKETVPPFFDPKVGLVQTPHHFFNQDIFQRAFRTSHKVPNEADMFNHGVLGARNGWGGAYFVGSGAVFRRAALEELGGFNVTSITEDIHTSQGLSARGWKTVFVNKDLAVGLSAENFASYLVQRQRWMQGGLQIFFSDNPLFRKGLTLRQRLAFFASLYYFFFPVAKVVFWATPLYFLLFHWHPIFSEVSVLLGYLVPYMAVLPLINAALLPGWPRVLFGANYENAIFFPLFRSMFDLVLPKKLGFKVTPKGIVSERRSFDFRSSRLTIIALGISLFAIGKGLFEFSFFEIEKDAYFFNLVWAALNAVFLLSALLVAWERPQRRVEERLAFETPVHAGGDGFSLQTRTTDISLSGFSISLRMHEPIPREVDVTFADFGPLTMRARRVYFDTVGKRKRRAGFAFINCTSEARDALLLHTLARTETWARVHERRTRNNLVMAVHFLTGLVRSALPTHTSRRCEPRSRTVQRCTVRTDGGRLRTALVRDISPRGLGLLLAARRIERGKWLVDCAGVRTMSVAFAKHLLPFVWLVGLRVADAESAGE